MKAMFTMLMGERRSQMFDFISKLPDYQGFAKAEIVDAGLDMLITNAQRPKEESESINFFTDEDEIRKTCTDYKKDKNFKKKLETWVNYYNEVGEL